MRCACELSFSCLFESPWSILELKGPGLHYTLSILYYGVSQLILCSISWPFLTPQDRLYPIVSIVLSHKHKNCLIFQHFIVGSSSSGTLTNLNVKPLNIWPFHTPSGQIVDMCIWMGRFRPAGVYSGHGFIHVVTPSPFRQKTWRILKRLVLHLPGIS